MKNAIVWGLLMLSPGFLCAQGVDALWTGSWEHGGNLVNRGDVRLFLPCMFSLRAQAIDSRPDDPGRTGFQPAGFGESGKNGLTSFSGGLYHKPTGSRLLLGILDEWGLPARIRNPWIRSLPFAENHSRSMADLKTEISSTKDAEAYLYLGSPQLEFFRDSLFQTSMRVFASVQIEADLDAGFGGGLDLRFGKKNSLLLEGFYTEGTLSERKSSTWFSESPPLPARDFRLYAMGLLFNSPVFSLGSDWAYSDTWAYGGDLYGNLGIRFGNFLPFAGGSWQLSLAADGAGNRYTGRDGSNPGAAFRSGGKFEWRGKRGGVLRINTGFRAPALGEDFNRSSSSVYFRFPSPRPVPRNSAPAGSPGRVRFPARLTRLSFSADRDGRDAAKILDSVKGTLGLSLYLPQPAGKTAVPPLGVALSGTVAGTAPEMLSPFPVPSAHRFDSAHTGAEFSWSPSGRPLRIPGTFQLGTHAGYTIRVKKDPFWDASFSAALRFKYGRVGIKAAAPEISGRKPFLNPGIWDYTISWRLEK